MPDSLPIDTLPIDSLRPRFEAELPRRPVVLSSPTGSGKSTQVPRWCATHGKVLVVEPRRVACRSLAQRVADLEGATLGREVGYHVRDEHRATAMTRILFATPGIVLRIFERIDRFDTVIVDEFHERGLEVDLLLALLVQRLRQGLFSGRLVIMSATLDGEHLAEHVDGIHLHAEGRTFPVDVRHLADGRILLPDVERLADRVRRAVQAAAEHAGDMLVFLPGKGEIAACSKALSSPDLEVLALHGGLSLKEQSRIFEPSKKRRVILATNVAETSLTVPGVGVVIDSGLVRQTRYVRDRGFLTLVPVALDSADQRSGRAGRTAPGVTFRLWSEAAQLEARTPPEIHRESLVPLLLAAAAQNEDVSNLPFADSPKVHAVETARHELQALGALDGNGRITDRGRRLFGLPLDAVHGRLLVEAEARNPAEPGLLRDMIDLVAALSVDRVVVEAPSVEEVEDDPSSACDAVASIRAMRGGLRRRIRSAALQEARSVRRRLVQAFELAEAESADDEAPVDRSRLMRCLLAADRRIAHVARQRGRRTAWSNGGTEIELGRDCGAARLESLEKSPEAVLVLQTVALGLGKKDSRVVITRAMPVTLKDLAEAGLGRARAVEPTVEDGRVVAVVERVYAKKVLRREQAVPTGDAARQAVAELFLARRLFKSVLDDSRENLEAAALARRLAQGLTDLPYWLHDVNERVPEDPPSFEEWVPRRLAELGVERGDDIELLSPEDLLFPSLPAATREELDRQYPRRLKIQGVTYGIDYHLSGRQVTLRIESGKPQKPPDRFYLPRFGGFKIQVEHKGVLRSIG